MTTFLTPTATHTDISACARHLQAVAGHTKSVTAVLDAATLAAITLLDPIAHAGASVISDRRHHRTCSVAATSHIPTLHAALEDLHHQGPCIDALRHARTVTTVDLATDTRWPALHDALSATATAHPCVVVPLITGTNEKIGALTLFTDGPDTIGDNDIALAQSLATHTAFAADTALRANQFAEALSSRDVIGQAKGMIMERFTIDAHAAFTLLTTLSQDANVRVAEIATRLVASTAPLPTSTTVPPSPPPKGTLWQHHSPVDPLTTTPTPPASSPPKTSSRCDAGGLYSAAHPPTTS